MFSKLFKKNFTVTEDVSQRQQSKLHTCKAFANDLCTYARTKKSTFIKSYKTVILQTSKSASLDSFYKPCSSTSSTSESNKKRSDPIDTGIDGEDQSDGTDSGSFKSFYFINEDDLDDNVYKFISKACDDVTDFDINGLENSLNSVEFDEYGEDFDVINDPVEKFET